MGTTITSFQVPLKAMAVQLLMDLSGSRHACREPGLLCYFRTA